MSNDCTYDWCTHLLEFVQKDAEIDVSCSPYCEVCQKQNVKSKDTPHAKRKKGKVALRSKKKSENKKKGEARAEVGMCIQCSKMICKSHEDHANNPKNRQSHCLILHVDHSFLTGYLVIYCSECKRTVKRPSADEIEEAIDCRVYEGRWDRLDELWNRFQGVWTQDEKCRKYITALRAEQVEKERPKIRKRADQVRRANLLAECGMKGISNLGNTCFMNSVLQVLNQTLPILRLCFSKGALNAGDVSCQLMAFCHHMWFGTSVTNVIVPKGLYHTVTRAFPCFSGYGQHDAHEFLRQIIDRLQYEHERKLIRERQPTTSNSISKIFNGEFSCLLVCNSCKNRSTRNEQFIDVSVGIEDFIVAPGINYELTSEAELDSFCKSHSGAEVPKCIANFCRPEVLQGENGYLCERCCEGEYEEQLRQEQEAEARRKAEMLKEIEESQFVGDFNKALNEQEEEKLLDDDENENETGSSSEEEDESASSASSKDTSGLTASVTTKLPVVPVVHRKLTKATRQVGFAKLPEILIIHLKRFHCDGVKTLKLTTPISFTPTISFRGLLVGSQKEEPQTKQHESSAPDSVISGVFATIEAMGLEFNRAEVLRAWLYTNSNIEATVELLLNGQVPTQEQLKMRLEQIKRYTAIEEAIYGKAPQTGTLDSTDDFDAQNEPASLTQYALYGVVEHHGSIHSGHYTSFVKKYERKDKRRVSWFSCSDSNVSLVSEREVLNSRNAYILFYERV